MLKEVSWIIYVCMLAIIVTSTVVIIGCTSEPASTTDTVTANQTTTTTTTTQPTTTSAMTQTATLLTTTTTIVTNDEPTAYRILDIIMPETVEGLFNISVVVINNTNSQLSCDIPIKLFRSDDLANFRTYIINVTLNTDETKEVASEDIYVPQGSYIAEVSDIRKSIEVG